MFGPWLLEYEGTNYEFGTPDHPVEVVTWGQDSDVYDTDDAPVPRGDGTYFGQDFIEEGAIQISVKIDFTDYPAPVEECVRLAMAARAELKRVWRAAVLRAEAGALAELTIGGEYVVEGRPRYPRFDDELQSVGRIDAELAFIPAHAGAYAAGSKGRWQEATLQLIPAQSGGLKAPLRAPLRTSIESTRAAPIQVDSEYETHPVIEFKGPIQSDAQIEIARRWRIYLNRPLRSWDVATIDTRPGRGGTYLNGVPVQLLDARSSLLAECSLMPGMNVVAIRGASIEGMASATVRWRNTKGLI